MAKSVVNDNWQTTRQDCFMDQNRIEGNRKLLVGKVTEKWCKLSEDDSAALNGKHERLEGKIQQLCGHGNHQVTERRRRLAP